MTSKQTTPNENLLEATVRSTDVLLSYLGNLLSCIHSPLKPPYIYETSYSTHPSSSICWCCTTVPSAHFSFGRTHLLLFAFESPCSLRHRSTVWFSPLLCPPTQRRRASHASPCVPLSHHSCLRRHATNAKNICVAADQATRPRSSRETRSICTCSKNWSVCQLRRYVPSTEDPLDADGRHRLLRRLSLLVPVS